MAGSGTLVLGTAQPGRPLAEVEEEEEEEEEVVVVVMMLLQARPTYN